MGEPRRRKLSVSMMRPPSTPTSRRSSITTPRKTRTRLSSRPSSRRGSLASLIPGPCESPGRIIMPPPSPAAGGRGLSFQENLNVAAGDRVLTIVRVKPEMDNAPIARPGVVISPCGSEISLPGAARSIGCAIGSSTPTGAAPTQTSSYRFDHVCDGTTTQAEMFALAGVPIADAWLEGYNGTIFAYGQTGSGKTHTLKGKSLRADNPNSGLMPRIMEYVFSKLAERRKNDSPPQGEAAEGMDAAAHANASKANSYDCTLSYLQIYSERISDLLERRTRGVPAYSTQGSAIQPGASFSQGGETVEWQDLKLREGSDRVYADGLTEVPVGSAEEAIRLIAQGNNNRKVAWTAMNAESSRSHTVLTLVLKCKKNGLVQTSCLNLIDLAGSENQATSQASNATQFEESCKINLSLTYLGSLLRDVASGRSFVNYRNSKLTLLLKDSLGGNSKTCVVATVNSELRYKQQTLSTLKFASHLKYVRNNAVRNVTAADSLEVWKRECRSLELKLKQAVGEIAVLKAHEAAREDKLEAQLRKKIAADIRRQVEREIADEQQTKSGVDEEELQRCMSAQALATRAQVSEELSLQHEAELQEAVRQAREDERANADSRVKAAEEAAEDARQQLLEAQLDTQMQQEQGQREQEVDKQLLLRNAASLKEQMSLSRSLLKRITQAESSEERLRDELEDAREVARRAERELRAGLGEAEHEAGALRARLNDAKGEVQHARECEKRAREQAASAEATLSAVKGELHRVRQAQEEQQELLDVQEDAIESSLEELTARARAAESLAADRQEQLQQEREHHVRTCARQEQALEALEWRRDMGEHALSTLARELKEAERKLSTLQGAHAEQRAEDSQCIDVLRARKEQLTAAKHDMERAFRSARSDWVTEKQALRDNARRLEADRQKAVIRSIQGEFEGDLDLATPERRFLLHAELHRLQEATQRLLSYHFFLMNDVLLYSKPMHRRGAKPGQPGRPQRYRMHRALKLALCRLVDLADTPELKHAFRVNSPQKAVVLVCTSAEQKAQWLQLLKKQIQECVLAREARKRERGKNAQKLATGKQTGKFQLPTPRRPSVLNRLAVSLTGRKARRSSVTACASSRTSTPRAVLSTPSKVLAGAVPMFDLNDTHEGHNDTGGAGSVRDAIVDAAPAMVTQGSSCGQSRPDADLHDASTKFASAADTAEATHCELCMRAFNALLRRRHSCGSCEAAVCSNCSQHRTSAALTDVAEGQGKKSLRQCDACHGDATGMLSPAVPILASLNTGVPSVQVPAGAVRRLSASEAARHFQRATVTESRRRLSSTADNEEATPTFARGDSFKENDPLMPPAVACMGKDQRRVPHRRASLPGDNTPLRTRHMV